MIPYVEVIGKYTLKPFALVEPNQCWFELSYYEKGEFQVYASATENNLNALKMGNYVKIPHKPYLWIIKSVEYTFNASGSRMISAKGYEAKWIVGQRVILSPIELSTNLGTAVYSLLNNNLGIGTRTYIVPDFNKTIPTRMIPEVRLNEAPFTIEIEPTQATRGNLWEFIANLLKTNHCGFYSTYEDGYISLHMIEGIDRSNYLLFSQSMDNLISANYYENSENKKTYCEIVSTFTEKDEDDENVSIDYAEEYDEGKEGIDRHEITITSNLSTKYTDDNGQEQETTPTSALFKGWQIEEGKNKLSEQIIKKEFNADIDLRYSQFEFVDPETQAEREQQGYETTNCFFIGDLVKARDEFFGYESVTRIIKYTFKQDAKGYGEEAEYQSE